MILAPEWLGRDRLVYGFASTSLINSIAFPEGRTARSAAS